MSKNNFDIFDFANAPLSESVAKLNSLNEGDYQMTDNGLHQEDPANDVIINEAMILDAIPASELETFLESDLCKKLQDMEILQEKSIVKLDKYAKKSKAETQAEIAIAKEKGDKDYKKLAVTWKLRKILLERIHKKHGAEAKKRVREQAKANKTKVPAFAKLKK